jgi:RNA-binding protein Tab2/Atab2
MMIPGLANRNVVCAMGKTWEIDFYSRPILDDQQKKVWELLICESPTNTRQSVTELFRCAQNCPSDQVNSTWLSAALQAAISQNEAPQRIRFFRRQMNNMILKACKDIGIPAVPSRRTIAVQSWLEQREREVYSQDPTYQGATSPVVQMLQDPPQPLPDAILGNKWAFVNLAVGELTDMPDWSIGFADAFPLELAAIDAEQKIPGLLIFSDRAMPIAGWISGLELAAVRYSPAPQSQVLLETGASDSWVLANVTTASQQSVGAEAANFEQMKQKANGVHFLAVQSDPNAEDFAGFWLLQERGHS